MKRRRSPTAKDSWREYARKGFQLLADAEGVSVSPDAKALLAIHSAILLADAVLLVVSGSRSAAEDHREVLGELRRSIRDAGPAERHLGALLSAKTRIEYTGDDVSLEDAEKLVQHAQRFASWCRLRLEKD